MKNTLLHELGTEHDQKIIMIHGTGMSLIQRTIVPCRKSFRN